MQGSVLVIEDTPEMAELVRLYLGKEGCRSTVVPSAEEGLRRLEGESFDLIVLDVQLPGMDGFEFLGRLRPSSSVPVLVLTARGDDEDLVLALGLGADDFLPKPFSPRVLAARCRALLRRGTGAAAAKGVQVHQWGNTEFNLETRQLTSAGTRVAVSAREFELLKFFVEHPGQPFRPQDLYEAVWQNAYGDLSAVGVYVQRLRKKLEVDANNPRLLLTERGFGYSFHPEAARQS